MWNLHVWSLAVKLHRSFSAQLSIELPLCHSCFLSCNCGVVRVRVCVGGLGLVAVLDLLHY